MFVGRLLWSTDLPAGSIDRFPVWPTSMASLVSDIFWPFDWGSTTTPKTQLVQAHLVSDFLLYGSEVAHGLTFLENSAFAIPNGTFWLHSDIEWQLSARSSSEISRATATSTASTGASTTAMSTLDPGTQHAQVSSTFDPTRTQYVARGCERRLVQQKSNTGDHNHHPVDISTEKRLRTHDFFGFCPFQSCSLGQSHKVETTEDHTPPGDGPADSDARLVLAVLGHVVSQRLKCFDPCLKVKVEMEDISGLFVQIWRVSLEAQRWFGLQPEFLAEKFASLWCRYAAMPQNICRASRDETQFLPWEWGLNSAICRKGSWNIKGWLQQIYHPRNEVSCRSPTRSLLLNSKHVNPYSIYISTPHVFATSCERSCVRFGLLNLRSESLAQATWQD